MLRRSLRLLRAGYYNADGSPTVSYKERLFKVFKRRKQNKIPPVHQEEMNYELMDNQEQLERFTKTEESTHFNSIYRTDVIVASNTKRRVLTTVKEQCITTTDCSSTDRQREMTYNELSVIKITDRTTVVEPRRSNTLGNILKCFLVLFLLVFGFTLYTQYP